MTPAARKESRTAWLFLAPAFLHLTLFALLPIAVAFGLSFFRWKLYRAQPEFVGLGNYLSALTDPTFGNAMWNSARYALVSVPAGMIVALAVAVLLAGKIRGSAIYRTLYYLPSISSGVALAMIWIYVFLPETGLINTAGKLFGIPDTDFLGKKEWAMWALCFMSVWTGLGPKMLLYLAGILGVPPSLYEAAMLDGATGWRAFRAITLPMLVPTSLFVLVTSTIGSLQVFTPVYMMTKGGPEGSTEVVGYHLYNEAWIQFNTGLASAKSFLLLLVIIVISIFQFRLMKPGMEAAGNGGNS